MINIVRTTMGISSHLPTKSKYRKMKRGTFSRFLKLFFFNTLNNSYSVYTVSKKGPFYRFWSFPCTPFFLTLSFIYNVWQQSITECSLLCNTFNLTLNYTCIFTNSDNCLSKITFSALMIFFIIKLQLQWVKTFYWGPVFSTTFFFNVIEDLMVVGIFRLHWSPLQVEL